MTVGNLAGDMLKNKFHPFLKEKVLSGVKLHRTIDSLTDSDPHFKKMLKYFRAEFGKYSPVVVDVLLDHLIADHWTDLFAESYLDFSTAVYRTVLREKRELPPPVSGYMERMAEGKWMDAYGSESGMLRVFDRLSVKASKTLDGRSVMKIYGKNRAPIEGHFYAFLESMRVRISEEAMGKKEVIPRIKWKN